MQHQQQQQKSIENEEDRPKKKAVKKKVEKSSLKAVFLSLFAPIERIIEVEHFYRSYFQAVRFRRRIEARLSEYDEYDKQIAELDRLIKLAENSASAEYKDSIYLKIEKLAAKQIFKHPIV